MKASLFLKKLLVFVCALVIGTTNVAFADEASTQAQINAMQQQLDAMKAQLDKLKAQQSAAPVKPPAAAAAPAPANTHPLLMRDGNDVTFLVGGNPVTIYGNLDVSLDYVTKGLKASYPDPAGGGAPPLVPVGNIGYMTGISSNLSAIGVRGTYKLGPQSNLVYQLETQLDIPATSGTANTNSNNGAAVKGGLTSRNTYVGWSSKYGGAFKIGKTDAPYKTSTARLNPFNGYLGDYSVIMGNSGGDNRVEFGTRLDHSIWYESPNWGGLTFNALVSPGMNRAYDNSNIPSGEPECAGGNLPGSGATPPACNDGSWGTVYSTNLAYTKGPLYLTAAYELHKQVNRTSDLAPGDPNIPLDVADEQGLKFGLQYAFSKFTTLGAAYEDLERYVPNVLKYQNERSRSGYYFSLAQVLTPKDNIALEWGHANPTPGDPGQHNTGGGLNPDNMANLYGFLYRHSINRHVSWYADWAMTANRPAAHYDLGAGGRGLTTDCHDASQLTAFDATAVTATNPTPISGTGPHCYAGGQLQGFSTGLKVTF